MGNFFKSFVVLLLFLLWTLLPSFTSLDGMGFKCVSSEQTTSLLASGEEYFNKGSYPRAIEIFTQVLDLSTKSEKYSHVVSSLLKLGLLHWIVGELELSQSFYTRAEYQSEKSNLKIEKQLAQTAINIYRLYQKAKRLTRQDKFEESVEVFTEAINAAEAIGSEHHKLKCLRHCSINYWRMSYFDDFHALNKQCLELAKKLNNNVEIARALNHIGLFNFQRGNYSYALNYYTEALPLFYELNKYSEASNILNNLANLYMYLGSYEKSLDYISQALNIDKAVGNPTYISMDMNNLGELYRRMASIDSDEMLYMKARDCFEESVNLAQKVGDLGNEIIGLGNLGNINLERNKFEESLVYSTSALEKISSGQFLDSRGRILNNIGFAYLYLNQHQESLSSFHEAIETGEKIGSYSILWEAYYGLGRTHEKSGSIEIAVKNYNKSIELINKLRRQISLDFEKAGFIKNKLEVYQHLIDLLYQSFENSPSSHFISQIFQSIEKAKSRAFLDMLNESNVNVRERLTPELRENEKAISERIAEHLRRLLNNKSGVESQENILKQLEFVEAEYEKFLNRVRVELPELSELISPDPYNLDQIQNGLLDNKTALLEYYFGENNSYLIAATAKNSKIHKLPANIDFQKSLKAYIKILSDEPTKRFKGAKASIRLYKELVEPVTELLNDSIENIIIIPDGVLYYLPFETLLIDANEENCKQKYLFEKYNISYMPSASSLMYIKLNKKERRFKKDLLAFGNPSYKPNYDEAGDQRSLSVVLFDLYKSLGFHFSALPYSGREINRISKFFLKTNCDVFLGEHASEHTFKSLSHQNYKIIHLACHGFLDEDFPLRSALVLSLSGNENEDGFLQARELYNLRLGAELVVLSACQTGQGKLESGEGVLGLQRVFFFAGAKSVVSTLWEIGDKPTAEFMEAFYKFIIEGYGKASALRQAKKMMMNSKYRQPFYWAGFVLSGENSSSIY